MALGALLLAGCTPVAPVGTREDAPAFNLHAQLYAPARASSVRTLVIVLHGDEMPGGASDPYGFADTVYRTIPHSAAVALLRPGYADAGGNRSPGERGAGTGDNYTSDRLDAVAAAITTAERRFPEADVIVVGDGGGAAIAANLAGVRPDLFDGMVLVSCPCALPEWRRGMQKRLGGGWGQPVASLDPLKTAGGVLPGLRTALVVGTGDRVTPPALSRAYAEALALRGIATDLRFVPGKGHDLLNDPEVLAATVKLAQGLATKR
ncbi:alpha/beta fold hydrolase [Sphingomonas sp. RS6]